MSKTLINFYIEDELKDKIDEFVSKSNNKYKDRTQFMILAIQEKLNEGKGINQPPTTNEKNYLPPTTAPNSGV